MRSKVIATDKETKTWHSVKLPLVEIFPTIEGEGTRAGFLTTFVRLYNCNLRCRWCDTTYSYAPHAPAFTASVAEIVTKVEELGNHYVCLTGGEPLLYTDKVLTLLQALAEIPTVLDIHIETGGAVDLAPFAALRERHTQAADKIRFILDYKLPSSGEESRMIRGNYKLLLPQDEIKFVIADEADFQAALRVLNEWVELGQVLFSPVFGAMPPSRLVELMRTHQLRDVKLSMQLHKLIWDPNQRGV
ncbi:radical SAM protein [Alicyclobacillus shizuokensis]|uniref:radical SAM protein n=1 Tax=Alicyclobacillus shizuokensis TaxID=392014 RepID=UPI000831C82F|nr:radical SAM protein [Alicyclobacillus shizuokensis]MCL6625951.1 radical SAM protein [Alicyclobacillus shizuokensis]